MVISRVIIRVTPAASEHPLQKDIQGPRRVYFFAAGARAHSLTHSLPAARRAPTAKKHTQQKKKHGFHSVTPFRALITLLITYLLSPLPLQVSGVQRFKVLGLRVSGPGGEELGTGFRLQGET